jgi:threonine/homoserine/homoserine lactone efflux protein
LHKFVRETNDCNIIRRRIRQDCRMGIDFAALAVFALVSSITPGPNNLMLMASGVNFGLARTLPHMLGVALGFTAMIVGVGAGVMQVFALWPPAYDALRALCLAYLVWLSWRIAKSGHVEGPSSRARPMTFLEAAAFQWVNPKAWAMALTAMAVYAPSRSPAAIVAVAVIFGAINLPSVGLWAAAGRAVRQRLSAPGRLRAFNWTMAALLLASTLPML